MRRVSVASSDKLLTQPPLQPERGFALFAVFPRHSCKGCMRLLQVAQRQRPALRQPGLKGQYANTYLHPYHQQYGYQTELIYFQVCAVSLSLSLLTGELIKI